MRKYGKDWLLLAAISAIYIAFCAYQLWDLPGEWYNDITTEHQEVMAILAGGWPWRFNLSAGPAYHYIVAGFAHFLGPTYATYKIASLVTGLAVLPLLYLLGRELFGRRTGLLAALVGALSFWLILFARLGSSPQILSPVLSAAAVYFVARFANTRRLYNIGISMVLAGFGLFTYPSTFVLPLVVLALIGWQLIFAPERKVQPEFSGTAQKPRFAVDTRMRWGWALIVALFVLSPFVYWFVTVVRGSALFSGSGYIGSKVAGSHTTLAGLGLTFAQNMLRSLGMFQFVGDQAFRTNVSGYPVLDLVSGLLMDLGLAWLLIDPRLRRRWGFVLIPILLLVAPSAGPGIPAAEIPSASRSLGAAPFVFLLVGMGLEAAWNLAARWITIHIPSRADHAASAPALQPVPVTGRPGGFFSRQAAWLAPFPSASRSGWIVSGLLVTLLVAGVAYLNVNHYFAAYVANLPENNQPWGTEIARFVDTLPIDMEVRLTSCCWGQWKQPTPQDIYYMLKHPQGRETLLAKDYTRTCKDLKAGESYALIFSPEEENGLAKTFQGCFPKAVGQMHYDGRGHPSFYTLLIR